MGIFSNKAIQVHAVLTTGIHGITGALINNPVGAAGITFDNQGAGTDPVITSNNADQFLHLEGWLEATKDFVWRSGTAFQGALAHNNSVQRTYSFPDVAGNVLVDADVGKTVSFAQLTIENVGAGGDPVLSSNSGGQQLDVTGLLRSTFNLLTDMNIKFKSGTAFDGIFAHNNSSNLVYNFPDIGGTVCMWTGGNATVNRYYSIGGVEIALARNIDGSGFEWVYDTANRWADSSAMETSVIPVHLPHGAIVTGFGIYGQETGSATLLVKLYRQDGASSAPDEMASNNSNLNFEELTDTSISNGTINNDTHSYYIDITISVAANECRISKIQITYTVTAPQP